MRSVLVSLALLLLSPGPQLCAQKALKQAESGYKRARKEPAGPLRTRAIQRYASFKAPSSVGLFLEGLGANAKAVRRYQKRIVRLDKRHAFLVAQLSRKLPPAKTARFTRERDEAKGDADFMRLQIRELSQENRLLRASIAGVVAAAAGDAGEELAGQVQAALDGAPAYPLRGELIHLCGDLRREGLVERLARLLAKSKVPRERADLAEALGASGSRAAEPALIAVLGDPYAVVRSTAVKALGAIGGADAVTALIERVPQEKGRLLEDVVLTLRFLTGVSFHTNVALWRDWWKNERPRYRRPGKRGKVVRAGLNVRNKALAGGGRGGFYGVQTSSHALVFLLDTSGSMNEPASAAGTTHSGRRDETKLDRAKRELVRVVQGLPSGVSINIIAYNDALEPYAGNMVTLTNSHRRAMIAWVKSLRAKGRTNIYDAMERVILEARGKGQRITKDMAIDTIFLLTDGMPTAGKITDVETLASEVQRLNAVTRIVIHTIGIGRGHARNLLKRLSDDSQGLYVAAR